MKKQNFDIFLTALLSATARIEEKYFQLPVSYQDYVYRERAYCYELYHQIRQSLPANYPYILSGEVNKAGHPSIVPYCGQIIPDFLIHNPGHMGVNDNLVIIEVKTVQGAHFNVDGKDLLKDIETINCMTTLENGYYKGILIIFGSNHIEKKQQIEKIYREKCNTENVLLIIQDNPLEQARVL